MANSVRLPEVKLPSKMRNTAACVAVVASVLTVKNPIGPKSCRAALKLNDIRDPLTSFRWCVSGSVVVSTNKSWGVGGAVSA